MAKSLSFINRVFNLRPGDFQRGLPLFGYYFLIISSYGMARAARDSLFLDRFKAIQLPYADIAIAALVGFIVAFYIRLGRKVSLRNLQVDYVDLLHIHWPTIDKIPLAETVGALVKAKRDGLTRHIGVANFNIALVEETMRLSPEPLATLQAEYHPYLDQTRVLEFCKRAGIVFTAYCPLGRGRLFKDPVIAEIARVKGRTIAQVALRWQIQQGNIAPIPRSANPAHMAESLAVFDFTLTDEEMRRIHALARPDGRIANPAGRAPAWD